MIYLYISVLLLFCAMCVGFCAVWWRWRRARSLLAHLPRYPTLPLIGNLHQIYGDSAYIFLQLMTSSRMVEETKSAFVSMLGPVPVVAVTDPADIKMVSNVPEKPYMYKFANNCLGNGLITAPGSVWIHTSKRLSGVFTTGVVDGYQDVINKHAQEFVNSIKTELEPFDVAKKYVSLITMEMIYEVTVGEPCTENGIAKEFHRILNYLMMSYLYRGIVVPYHLDCIFRLTPSYRRQKRMEDKMNGIVDAIILKRKAEKRLIKETEVKEKENGRSSFKPYLDILLELSETDELFTEKQIRDELITILAAGHETVANTLTMCLLMIGSHPQVQDKLYEEMRHIFGESDRTVSKDDLSRMRYCEAVINETLRLYPAVPICLRYVDRDLELKSCTIPEGTTCAINIWGAGRSRRSWGEDAEVFRPERWLQHHTSTPFFIPFSYGKRSCIGKRYSMAMLKTTLAHCVRELVIDADVTGLRLKIEVTLQPFAGHHIQVRSRNHNKLINNKVFKIHTRMPSA